MKKYVVLTLLCFIPRFIFLIFYRNIDPLFGNLIYWSIADSLLEKGVFGLGGHLTTYYEPLYPIFLAAGRMFTRDSLFGLILLQIGISCVGAIFLYKLALRLSENRKVAFLAALFYSFYPYLIRQSIAVIEVPLLTTLIIAACYFYSKEPSVKNAFGCGITLGLSILTRIVMVPIGFIAIVYWLIQKHYRAAGILLAAMAILVLSVSRMVYHGEGSFLPSRNGQNMFLANCEYTDQIIPKYSLDVLIPYWGKTLKKEKPELLSSDEEGINRCSLEKAFEFIRRQPLRALKIRFLNIFYLFYPRIVPFYKGGHISEPIPGSAAALRVTGAEPHSLAEEISYTLSYGFIFITGLWGIFLRRHCIKKDLILYIVLISFVAVHSVYWPATRIRSPIDFIFMFFSAFAIAGRLAGRK